MQSRWCAHIWHLHSSLPLLPPCSPPHSLQWTALEYRNSERSLFVCFSTFMIFLYSVEFCCCVLRWSVLTRTRWEGNDEKGIRTLWAQCFVSKSRGREIDPTSSYIQFLSFIFVSMSCFILFCSQHKHTLAWLCKICSVFVCVCSLVFILFTSSELSFAKGFFINTIYLTWGETAAKKTQLP